MYIIFDLILGRFDFLVEKWDRSVPFKVTRECPGVVLVDVGRFRLMFTNHKRVALAQT